MGLNPKWLSPEQFKNAVDLLPLVSIDLCVICGEKMLLGNRNNRPAKNWLFTPGGRIKKSEPIEVAIQRICLEEINYPSLSRDQVVLMGAWDHFYTDSAFDKDISTHYINLPHYFSINQEKKESFDLSKSQCEQHSSWTWMPVKEASIHSQVHPYVREYALWLLDNT